MAPNDAIRAQNMLAHYALEHHPDESARILERQDAGEVVELFEKLPPGRTLGILNWLTPDLAAQVVGDMSAESVSKLMVEMDPNRAATLLARLDPETRETRLAALDSGLANELRSLLEYPPDSAGRLMDPRATAFQPDASVHDVISRLRTLDRGKIQDIFAVDQENRLVGSVPLQDLFLAPHEARLETLLRKTAPRVEALSSREEVVSELERHRAGSLPVVDFDGRLLGVLRQDELIEAATQEATADLLTMVGANKNERALSTPFFAVKKRLPWLEVNLLTAFLAAAVVGAFEDTIARFTALAVLLPVVAGQSGNTGAQALAVTMRGLALREIRMRHWLRVSIKELIVGCTNGVAVALTTSVAVYVWSRSLGLALVIGISMVLSMMAAGVAGASVPMVLTALRQDPAQSSSIILTTITDVTGFLSFLGIATLLASMI